MMTWIERLIEETREYEAPRQYYFWSGLAAISAVVKDHVYLERGSDRMKTYPNVYILILAKTGITKKSHPISLIEQIVVEAQVTRVISGRSSIEKIIDDLGTTATLESGKVRKILKDACGFIVSGELSASIISNSQALTILTNLYDRQYNVGDWTINLKSGMKKLSKPTITFLAATNDQYMKSFFEAKDMYGGFLGRTLVISADVPKRLNALVRRSEIYPNIKELAGYLEKLSKLTGPFQWDSDEVMVHYETWYENFYGPVQRGEAEVNDKTGTFSRIGDHVLKVAMLLSLSESLELKLKMTHLQEAISLCEPFVEISERAVRGIGKNTLAAQIGMVMDYLEARGGSATRVSILQKFQGDIDHVDLNHIAAYLEESNFMNVERHGTGQVFQMPKKVLEKYKAWKESRKKQDSGESK
jgi:hypothetical protein